MDIGDEVKTGQLLGAKSTKGQQLGPDPIAPNNLAPSLKAGVNMLILLIILLVLALGSAPAWPYSRGWGYAPSGGLGTIVLLLLILWLLGII